MTASSNSDRDYLNSYVTESIAAEFLSCSKRTLQYWRLQGGGPLFLRKSKRFVRYRRRDLIAWATDNLAHSTSDSPGTSSGLTPGQSATDHFSRRSGHSSDTS